MVRVFPGQRRGNLHLQVTYVTGKDHGSSLVLEPYPYPFGMLHEACKEERATWRICFSTGNSLYALQFVSSSHLDK
jgi:hypothetical protein